MSFADLGLCNLLLKTVLELEYIEPSPIQIKAIPEVLSQGDLIAVAQTGTGKTAAFGLPVIQLLSQSQKVQAKSIRALVMTPTRELAAQVTKNIESFCRHMNINSTGVYGGIRIEPQIARLQEGVDVLVATPGRLLDLYEQQAVFFEQLEILVLDEADRILELGFIDDIQRIQSLLPKKRQTLMFSATFSKEIKALASGMLNDPTLIEIHEANSVVDKIKQVLHPVDKTRKTELLIHLVKKNKWHQVLVFSRTKQGADTLVQKLVNAGVDADSIHANRTQHARTQVLNDFKKGKISVLVATDIASRGIDIIHLTCVINFDLPYVAEDYVHRVGRTGRAGSSGVAITLFCEDEAKQLQSIERNIGKKLNREVISGFAPVKQTLQKLPKEDENDLYGNFEADVKPSRGRQGKGRGRSRLK